jgi:cytochrome b561
MLTSGHRLTGYSTAQVILHWTVALLVILQVVFREGIEEADRTIGRGEVPDPGLAMQANAHVAFGMLIFILALVRLALRLTRGAPPPPASEPAILRLVAHAVHMALYAVILLMPVTGALAWFGGIGWAGFAHGAALPLVLALVGLHVFGALYQHFGARTDVLRRMMRPEG